MVPGARLIAQIVVSELLEPWETKIGSPATIEDQLQGTSQFSVKSSR